jgi:hypothetical protein
MSSAYGGSARVTSPRVEVSTRITSAPRWASCIAANGPAHTQVRSMTRTPARGRSLAGAAGSSDAGPWVPGSGHSDDIDAYEVNEAFAPVPLAWAHELGVDEEKLNPRGGAIALGHPLGASGTRLLTTLVNHLEATGGRYGLQTMCEGGGLANATIIERL